MAKSKKPKRRPKKGGKPPKRRATLDHATQAALKYGDIYSCLGNKHLKPEQQRRIVKSLTDNQIGGLQKITQRFLDFKPSQTNLTERELKNLARHIKFIKKFANPKTKIKCRRRMLNKRGGSALKVVGQVVGQVAVPLLIDASKKLVKSVGKKFKKWFKL